MKKKILSIVVSSLFCFHASAETYTMMVAPGFPPFSDYGASGNIEGFDVDLVKAIAKEEGFTINIVAEKWTNLFKQLDAGNADILRGIYYDEKRAEKYQLSSPYFLHKTILLTKNKLDYASMSFDDFMLNKRISVLEASSMYESMKKTLLAKYPDVQVVESNSQFFAFKQMMMDKADYVYFTSEYAPVFTKNYPNYQYQTIALPDGLRTEFKRVFALRKDKPEFHQKIESGLKKIHQNGEYDRIYQKYFGSDESMKL